MYARIYTNKTTGKVSCRISECKKVKNVFKRREIKIDDLVVESFKGSCVIRVYQVYVGSSKTITLSVEEIMATKPTLNPISTGLFCLVVALGGGGCFPPPFHNSFVFKVRLLKFCTEILSDRMNNLR